MLIQPVIMVLLFGGVVSNTPRHVAWAVLDRDGTEPARRLAEEIATTGYFSPPREVHSYAEAERLIGRGEVPATLVVPETFRRDAARGAARVQLLRRQRVVSAARAARS